jgi:putative transposase
MSLSLRINDVVEIDGEVLHFHHRTLAGDLSFENRATADTKTVALGDLLSRFAKGEIALRVSTEDAAIKALDLSSLKSSLRRRIDVRLAFVKAILAAQMPKRMAQTWPPIIAEVAALHRLIPPSWETVRRWVNKYKNNQGDARSLIPCFSARGRKAHARSDAETDFLNSILADCVASELAPPITAIHRIVVAKYAQIKAARADTVGWKCPSLDWLYAHFRRVSAYDRARLQQGRAYATRHFAKIGKGVAATFRLEVVEIDHTRANVSVKDESTGADLGRPWITIAIDRFTRMVVGLYIGFEPPSVYSVGQCLRNMILPKSYLKELCPDLMLGWEAYGVPVSVVVDNAMEFRSDYFKRVSACLGFDIHQQPVDKPEFKGIVERFNRSLEDGGMILPNRTFGSVAAKGKRRSVKGASMTLTELRAHLHFWIVAVYCNRTHLGILDVPARKWEEDAEAHPLRLPSSVRDLDFVLGITKRPKLTRLGIRAHNLFYNSKELSHLFNRIGSETVDVSTDPSDVSRCLVTYVPEQLQIAVPCTDKVYADGLTLHQHNLIRALARKRNEDFSKHPIRVAARDAFFLKMADVMARSAARHRSKRAREMGLHNVAQPFADDQFLESMICEPQADLDLQAVLAEDAGQTDYGADSADAAQPALLATATRAAAGAMPMQKMPLKGRKSF